MCDECGGRGYQVVYHGWRDEDEDVECGGCLARGDCPNCGDTLELLEGKLYDTTWCPYCGWRE